MSKSEKKNQKNTAETQEPVLTRYDLKMQRRKEQKKKEQRDKRIAQTVGILVLIGLACWLISFPVRSWLTVHGTYVVVADEKVSRVEFDYNYYTVMNNYIASNGYILSAFYGLDLNSDLSAVMPTLMYSDTLSWQDYFEEMAVNNLLTGIAMRRDMEAAGFTYDESEEYESFVAAMKQAAEEAGVSFKEYIKSSYGPYATLGRVEGFIRDNLKISAYLEAVAKDNEPSDDEIQAYYEENRDNYDCVDYHMLTVNAELPAEPTELADPVEETDETASGDGEETYTPSQAEIDAAMALAKAEAEGLQDTVASGSDESKHTNETRSKVNYQISDWLFDSERKKGDTTVIEDTYNNCYYVVSFDGRYINPSVSVNVRAVLAEDGNGQQILDEWAAGEATEDSFAALADRYNNPLYLSTGGGLIENIDASILEEEISVWMTDEARAYGDTAVITTSDASLTYVFYYVSVGDPVWKVNIRDILIDTFKTEYVSSLTEGLSVEDPHHNLYYLQVRAQEEAAEAAAAGNGADDSDDVTSESSSPE